MSATQRQALTRRVPLRGGGLRGDIGLIGFYSANKWYRLLRASPQGLVR